MAVANLLDSRTTTFGELVGNGRVYRVPRFQRDYSWREEEWEDLWTDVVNVNSEVAARHYMGTIVIRPLSDREFEIIDGQQRIATLSVLALAIISRLQRLVDQGVEPDENRDRITLLRRSYVGDKDPSSLTYSSKLFLNQTDDGFYQANLVQLRTPVNPRGLRPSNARLWNALKFFQGKIDSSPALAQAGAKLASLLSEVVARRLLFIQITVEDDLNAYTVFETLNARGLELSSTDLLKNYLFSRLSESPDIDQLQRLWQRIIDTVGQDKLPSLLRYYLQQQHMQVRESRVFRLVRDSIRTPVEVFDLVGDLERHAELFVALSDELHDFWLDRPGCREWIRELALFNVTQVFPMLFAAYYRCDVQEFERILKLMVSVSFRYQIVGGLNPRLLEPVYARTANKITRGEIRTARQAHESIADVYISDDKFEGDFAVWEAATSGRRKRLAKYVLAKIEERESRRPCDFESDDGTIEHILPENAEQEWEAEFPPSEQQKWVDRVGNLALLERSLNRAAGNDSFEAKKAIYAGSRYETTKTIEGDAWTRAAIERRQRAMARLAKAIWRSDFS